MATVFQIDDTTSNNIAKVTARAKGQPALRVAPRRSPAHSTPYVVSLEVDTG
jgi:hypothetical protein